MSAKESSSRSRTRLKVGFSDLLTIFDFFSSRIVFTLLVSDDFSLYTVMMANGSLKRQFDDLCFNKFHYKHTCEKNKTSLEHYLLLAKSHLVLVSLLICPIAMIL